MTTSTPAVERATRALDALTERANMAGVRLRTHAIVAAVLPAALTDPDDPDSLARTLFTIHEGVRGGISAERALWFWLEVPELVRADYREIADGLRMMLVGSGA